MIVVAESPATDLVEALGAAGAFPIVEANWAEASAAFDAVRPAAVIIAEPGPPPSESAARSFCEQVATVDDAIVPMIARVEGDRDAAVPTALPNDASLPVARLIARLQSALRVRALHATVLRRMEMFASRGGKLLALPVGDPLDDATVLIAGRGPRYPALSVAIGERVNVVGALSIQTAARHLNARDLHGIVVGDGFPLRMVEAFLTVLAQDARFHDIPVAVIGEAPPDFAESLANIEHVAGDPARLVARMMPLVRMRAFDARLKRMLKSLDADGMFDPDTGLLTREDFWQDLAKTVAESGERSQPLSMARISFDGALDARTDLEAARLLTRLIRNIDFASREDDGSLLVVFTQTDLHAAHVVARRIAATLKNTLLAPHNVYDKTAINVTLATLKAGDTLDSLMLRVMGGSQAVAAE
jgi:GGDEF domain-containing protein